MPRHCLFCVFYYVICCVSPCGFAQYGQWHTKHKKAIRYIETARQKVYELDPETGLPHYKKALLYVDKAIEKDPDFWEAHLLKADYSMRLNRKADAIEAYRQLIAIEDFQTSTGYVYHELATLELSEGMYDEAYAHAQTYQSYTTAPKTLQKENRAIMETCAFAIAAKKRPVPFEPQNMGAGVNTSDPEYFPTLTVEQDELLFTRRLTAISGVWQEDFFISKHLNNYWNTAQSLPQNINTPFNEGAPTFAPDGKTLIFVGCAIDRLGYGSGRRGYGSCDLFVTKKVGDEWYDPINLPGEVNTVHWETQPSLSADGKTLYFIRGSTRNKGGRSQRNGDIYVSKMKPNGAWGKAEKLPPNINTPYSESSVLIHPDGKTLYFSSNGHLGMGGSDLFMTTLQPDGSWSTPKNLGYPINTHHDENSLLVYANGEFAVFASDRPGGMGNLDLYTFKIPDDVRPTRTIYVTGKVFDALTDKTLQATFTLKDFNGKAIVHSVSDSSDGSFVVPLPIDESYALSVNKRGYLPYTLHFDLTVAENSEAPYHIDIPLQSLTTSDAIEHKLANVFFDLDDDQLRATSFVELDDFARFLNRHPSMSIELQGHTDDRGDEQYNMDLSTRRAKAVYAYLVSAGVDSERMRYKGYGATKPSSFTENGETVFRTKEWIEALSNPKERKAAHQQNRRTVYIVRQP